MDTIKQLLVTKFEEIHRRMILVLNQLNDEQVNWRPNESSNSIANLIVHIRCNIKERIGKGINRNDFQRDRDGEFEQLYKSRQELIELTNESFGELIETAKNMTGKTLMDTQLVRDRERTNLDLLMQCAAHFSEHLGQVMYIGKMIRDAEYVTTSIPKKSRSNIRRMEPKDISEVAVIIKRNLEEHIAKDHSQEVITKFISHNTPDQLEKQASWKDIYIIEDKGEVVGTGAIANFGTADNPKICVSNLYILPERHGSGLGKALITYLMDKTWEKGVKAIFVPSSRNAVEFYKRHGFTVEEVQVDWADEIIWMKKERT
ncbi:MAG: hypothetical protein K0R57_2431 [Paenibacillaceae bacterium]|nr:hypothetical protein [Paenibacillaceae bacterium]